MEKIIVAYWRNPTLEMRTGIKHLDEFKYSSEKIQEIVNIARNAKLNIMILNTSEKHTTIYMDEGRFRQM